MFDLHNHINVKELFPPKAAVIDNTPQVSAIIDLAGTQGCEFVMITGTETGAGTYAALLEDGNDPALADHAPVVAPNLLGTDALASFTFGQNNACFKLGYSGSNRFVRLTLTPTGNTGNLFLAGVAILKLKAGPTTNPPN